MELNEATDRGLFARDLNEYGVVKVEGYEFPELLHRLSTNDTKSLQPGDSAETILITEKAKIIDMVHVLCFHDYCLLLASPHQIQNDIAWLEKYTIMEDITYRNISNDFDQFEIYSQTSGTIPSQVFEEETPQLWHWKESSFRTGDTFIMYAHESVSGAGLRVLFPGKASARYEFRTMLAHEQMPVISEEEYHLHRIQNGLPAVGFELSDMTNPLECGAERAVMFTKGCYIGQEVIARMDSYDKVQRRLHRLQCMDSISRVIQTGTSLTHEGKNAGFLTSSAFDPREGKTIALGCVRVQFNKPGTVLDFEIEGSTHSTKVI